MSDHDADGPLGRVDLSRREALRALITGATAAVPIVASFSIEGLSLKTAYAAGDQPDQPQVPNDQPQPTKLCVFYTPRGLYPTGRFERVPQDQACPPGSRQFG